MMWKLKTILQFWDIIQAIWKYLGNWQNSVILKVSSTVWPYTIYLYSLSLPLFVRKVRIKAVPKQGFNEIRYTEPGTELKKLATDCYFIVLEKKYVNIWTANSGQSDLDTDFEKLISF